MEHRLGRTVRVFLIVLAMTGFYRLTVVPWVEPRVPDGGTALEMTPREAAAIRARADQRLASLGDVFPSGSWELDQPIMLESRQTRLLFREYHSLPDGRVNLVPCTLVILPDRNRVAAAGTAGRTLVLRAPQGAVLEFDEPLDLRQGRLAKLIGGSLRGQVTIRGTPTTDAAEDDIEIVTRDITLDELQVQTNEMVQFRYGRSSGSGRGLVARLKPREGPVGQPTGDQGPNIGGVDSIRIDRDVRMRIEGVAGNLLPGQAAAADPESPPVLVSCRGSLCLNVSANVITLEDHVDVVRASAAGASDRLACDLLAILLGRREEPATAAGVAATGGRGSLQPVEIQAKGGPVVVTSSGAGLEARAARLGYEIATRRILLDGEEPVSLAMKGTEMEARKIDYCPGPPGEPGSLMAVGPGWLQSRGAQTPPTQVRWQQWLRMRPDGDGDVVSIAGDAEVAVEAQGRLAATEMHLWLDRVADRASEPRPDASPSGPDLSRLRPSRLLARGMVEADADQAAVKTDRLELWFRSDQPVATPAAAATMTTNAPAAVAAGAAGGAAPGGVGAALPGMPGAQSGDRSRGKLAATAALVRGLVILASSGAQLEEMSMEGQVRLVEQPLPAAGPGVPPPAGPVGPPPEKGMEIDGEQLQLTRAMRFDARAVVSGKPARVRGRGLDLEGPLLEFDRGRGRLTVDGAGRITVPLAAGTGGLDALAFSTGAERPAAPPQQGPPGRLDVIWQGRMDFDGLKARFIERVEATSATAKLQAGSLDVIFDRAFDLTGEGPAGGAQPEVARIACGSGAKIESESIGKEGGRSREQLFARDLVIDRITGDVSGSGPGRLSSTRFGEPPAVGLPAGPQGPVSGGGAGLAVQPVAATRPSAGLSYLGVDFQRGMRGNLNRRMMEFHQRVEAIWGPVANWGDTLDPHAPRGLPEGVFTVSCDVLGLGQSPLTPGRERPAIEMAAGGNVLVEGESFTARSARLTWSEAKDLLVFEGDGRSDAQLFRQFQAGAQPSSASAGKILYWRALNRVDVEDARFLDLDQLRGGAAPAGPAAAGPRGPGGPAVRSAAPLPQRPLPGT